jgi:hypothetical protein
VDAKLWIVAFVVSRVAGTTLLWIARPAANADLPPVSSRQATLELAIGIAAAIWTGWNAPPVLVAAAVIVRLVMAFSYRKWGGIHRASYHTARIAVLLTTLFIASLPESSLYSFGR